VGERQESLQGAISWSHDLLARPERILFRRLSVFRSGFTVEAAERVGADEDLDAGQVEKTLAELVDQSLVVLGGDVATTGRYRLLEPIRMYADERLKDAAEEPFVGDRHAEFYAQLTRECAQAGDKVSALHRLDADYPNVLEALKHLACTDRLNRYGQVLAELWWFWDRRGLWQEARQQIDQYLASPADHDRHLCGQLVGNLGDVAAALGNYTQARASYEEQLRIARELGDRNLEGSAAGNLGRLALSFGNSRTGRASLKKARRIARRLDDRRLEGEVDLSLGRYRRAGARFEEALRVARERTDDVGIVGELSANLGVAALCLRKYDKSRDRLEEARRIARELRDRTLEGLAVGNLGLVDYGLRHYSEARAHLEECEAIASQLGDDNLEGLAVGNLGVVDQALGDYREARARYVRARITAHKLGYRSLESHWTGNARLNWLMEHRKLRVAIVVMTAAVPAFAIGVHDLQGAGVAAGLSILLLLLMLLSIRRTKVRLVWADAARGGPFKRRWWLAWSSFFWLSWGLFWLSWLLFRISGAGWGPVAMARVRLTTGGRHDE
jgi:tetratricopeptide (TPR) repeat protein